MEPHGGYVFRLQSIAVGDLVETAIQALRADGKNTADCSLSIATIPAKKIVRVGYDGPFTYGRPGACWYADHHAFARFLSRDARTTVHAYAIDPDEFEMVATFGGGRKVGGEAVRYDQVEAPDDEDEFAFERLKSRWPLGHLAKIFGVPRNELLRIPRAPSLLLNLDQPGPDQLLELFATQTPRSQPPSG